MKNDNLDHSIAKVAKNAKKTSRDLKKFTVTQTPAKDHRLMLEWKTRKE